MIKEFDAVLTFGGSIRRKDVQGVANVLAAYSGLSVQDTISELEYLAEGEATYKIEYSQMEMIFSGKHQVGRSSLVECIELPTSVHPWFVGTQAHPEFASRPNRPSPLYRDFLGAAIKHRKIQHER